MDKILSGVERRKPPWLLVMSGEEFNILSTYNSEVARGLVHTEEWTNKMAELQQRFNQVYKTEE